MRCESIADSKSWTPWSSCAYQEKIKLVEMEENLINRPLNEGFPGVKKRNEILQMAYVGPETSHSRRRPTPVLISMRCGSSPTASALRRKDRAMIVITHYQRLLNYIVPDFIHVLHQGRIIRSGTKELALELEVREATTGSSEAECAPIAPGKSPL